MTSMDHEPDLLKKIDEISAATADVSKLVSIKDFIARWRAALNEDELTLQGVASLPYSSVVGSNDPIPADLLEELFIVTNPIESLYCEGMAPLKPIKLEDVPAECKLQTIRHSKNNRDMRKMSYQSHQLLSNIALDYSTKQEEHLAHKYAAMDYERERIKKKKSKRDDQLMTIPEAIITVHIHKPQSTFGKLNFRRGHKNLFVHILTQTSLTQLRNAIKCPKDLEIPGDFSMAPDSGQNSKRAKDLFSSAIFFIENTFYVERQNLESLDYSKPIVEWLRKKGVTQSFPVKVMSLTKMIDLKIRFGMPYVFIHQGNCEHVIQFTDMRLMHSDDCQTLSQYPLQLTTSSLKFTVCNACQTRPVKWMVANSVHSPCDPAHYCDVCFKMFHYNAQGEKTCDFKAFQYTDNMLVDS